MPIQRPTFQRPDPPASTNGERTRLAITLGDPNGIGPEVLLKCLHDPELTTTMAPVVIGSAHVLRVHADALGYSDLTIHAVDTIPDEVPETGVTVLDVTGGATPDVSFGEVTKEGGTLAMQAVDRAVDACLDKEVAAMVTAPISKDAIAKAGYNVPGHTEFISKKTGGQQPTMMMVAGALRVGLVTAHIPISQVAEGITETAIRRKLDVMVQALKQDFAIPEPKVAVLGLNPHAGDGGVLGREEEEIIEPTVEKARADGINVHGPLPADGYFATQLNQGYDAVLAMYHDQGLVPFKALAFDRGVNYTAGLPIVRTSPDHGTAYGIAGRGMALPGSMRSAIEEAVAIARHRAAKEG